jgi:hypothetical protein
LDNVLEEENAESPEESRTSNQDLGEMA